MDSKSIKNEKKIGLNDFFRQHQYTLLVLSIFLLITVELVGKTGYLNDIMSLLSALMTYFLFMGIDMYLDKDKESIPLMGFTIVFPIFITAFCAWVILNIAINLQGTWGKVIWILIWLGFMIVPAIRFWFKKNK